MHDWVDGMRRIAMNAYENSQPCDVCFGTVRSPEPLEVSIEELKLTVRRMQMVVPDYLTDRTVPVTVGGESGMAVIPGALKAGDRVVLLRKSGGQKYIVIGKEG